MNRLARLYLALHGNGWFEPSTAPGRLPSPSCWQAWLMTLGDFLLLFATLKIPADAGWAARIALVVGYVAVGMLTCERPGQPPQ